MKLKLVETVAFFCLNFVKVIHRILKKFGTNVSLGKANFFFISKVLRTGLTDMLNYELSKGSVFIDIGANISYYSIVASKLVGEGKNRYL